jgi:hypothetical protein
MDPLTALLRAIEMVMEIHKLNIESMSGADRLAYGHMVIEDMQRWREMLKPFMDLFQPKPSARLKPKKRVKR